MNKNIKIRRMTGIAFLVALVIELQFMSNYVTIGPVSITLSLIPIVIGAILYGPTAGAFLGAVSGIITIFAPSTQLFLQTNPVATVILCILKMTLAGLVSGFIFKLLNKKAFVVATILASIAVPLVNTGTFILGVLAFFMPLVQDLAGEGQNAVQFLFVGIIGYNFLIEFAAVSIFSPSILQLVRIFMKSHNFGSNLENN